MYSFAGLIRRTPPPTFSDAAITDRHSDTTIFQLRAHWVRISCSIGSEKSFGHVPRVGVDSMRERRTPYPLGQALRSQKNKRSSFFICFEWTWSDKGITALLNSAVIKSRIHFIPAFYICYISSYHLITI